MVCINCGATFGHLSTCSHYGTAGGYVDLTTFFKAQHELMNFREKLQYRDIYIIVQWPESQDFIGKHNCHLINDEEGYEKYGSSAYFVRIDEYERIIFDKFNPPRE
jgi:hypothetical protein